MVWPRSSKLLHTVPPATILHGRHMHLGDRLEINAMVVDVPKIFFGFSCGAGSQAFVVLDLPASTIFCLLLPLLVLNHCKELQDCSILGCLDNRSDELLQKALVASEPQLRLENTVNIPVVCLKSLFYLAIVSYPAEKQVGPKIVKKIDQETLDVRAIVILVCHDHHLRAIKKKNGY